MKGKGKFVKRAFGELKNIILVCVLLWMRIERERERTHNALTEKLCVDSLCLYYMLANLLFNLNRSYF